MLKLFRAASADSGTIYAGQVLTIDRNVDRIELDSNEHMRAWIAELELLMDRPLRSNDQIFPPFNRLPCVATNATTPWADWKTEISPIIHAAGVRGRCTSSCLRQSSVQWRTLYAPSTERWGIDEIRRLYDWPTGMCVCYP